MKGVAASFEVGRGASHSATGLTATVHDSNNQHPFVCVESNYAFSSVIILTPHLQPQQNGDDWDLMCSVNGINFA